ncbi:MAG: hypothetical protein JXA93_14080 [Anaerolineae bacterium]|nr:hypothetical protein [Anaerolineae bacterium]
MQWQDIRKHYPASWLLVEALKAHSAMGKRVVEELAVLNTFGDAQAAMNEYVQLHRHAPGRELYVLHTDRETLDIEEHRWLGIRGVQ